MAPNLQSIFLSIAAAAVALALGSWTLLSARKEIGQREQQAAGACGVRDRDSAHRFEAIAEAIAPFSAISLVFLMLFCPFLLATVAQSSRARSFAHSGTSLAKDRTRSCSGFTSLSTMLQ